MGSITRRHVWRQFKKDIIGKDSHRGVTLTYSWLANQFGHFSLGFIPTFLLYLILEKNSDNKQGVAIQAFLIVGAIWLVFEAYNLIVPIWFKRRFKTVVRFRQKMVFKPDKKNLAFDTITDLGFFWTGACTAGIIMASSKILWIILLILVGFVLIASSIWYVTKIYLQAAQYPFQFRLSQWEHEISNENIQAIEKFRNEKQPGNHLFVFGPANAGKSSLGVGIATELSIHHTTCLYATAMKLFWMFFEAPRTQANSDTLWTWHNAQLLVIDDINAGDPVQPDVISPEAFSRFLRNQKNEELNLEAIRGKNVIWVMGNEDCSRDRQETWKRLLKEEIGVDPSRITAINLSKNGVVSSS